jgi:Kef-type K+ transport system membrane component KefB
MTSAGLVTLLITLGTFLILGRLFAEAGRRYHLPIVMGEIVLGILAGPTLFGKIFPDQYAAILPATGVQVTIWGGIIQLAVIMLLFVAGLEIQFRTVLAQGKTAIFTSVTSMVIPLALGFITVSFFPQFFVFGNTDRVLYALFFGVAMAVSAVPVIARILMDLNLYKTKVGSIIMAAAVTDDIVGWLLFSLVLSHMGLKAEITNLWQTAALMLGFALVVLTIGRKLIDAILPWIQTKLSWPGGVLSICLGLGFLGAAFTEFIGLHAILGAFLTGIAIGDSPKLRDEAREIVRQFVTNVFAPLFFVNIGLRVNFVDNFDLNLCLIVLFLACFCKVFGATLGAKLGGLPNSEALAVGFGLNARGVMEIILGKLALDYGVIDAKMYVALVTMAIATSIISGPLMRKFMPLRPLTTDRELVFNP